MVVGLGPLSWRGRPPALALVDGDAGTVIFDPEPETQRLFGAALDLPESARAAFVESQTDDPEVRRESAFPAFPRQIGGTVLRQSDSRRGVVSGILLNSESGPRYRQL